MTFLTSQYPSDIEVWTNGCRLGADVPTFAHSLSLAGYETVLCGRMHFTGEDQHRGFQRRLVGDVSGAMASTPPGGKFEGIIPDTTAGQTYRTMDAVGAGRSAYIAYDDDVTRGASDFLRRRAQEHPEQPFCMVTGFLLPHSPYICPKRLFDEYIEQIEMPHVPEEYTATLHPAVARWRETRGVDHITAEQARAARAAYYGLVTYMDERIGEILKALDSTPFAENTVVVYLSDHGEMAGEHGMWWKDSFYEGSVGIPMIWSWPKHFDTGRREDAIVNLVDVGPTLLDFAGAESLPDARGQSLAGLLNPDSKSSTPWRNTTFSETYTAKQRPARMIRSGPWKLNAYHGYAHPQLFNIESDPGELVDLGKDPAHAEIVAGLLAQVQDGWSPERIERAVARNKKRHELVTRWRRNAPIGESERWSVPAGSNLFPEL